MVNHKDDWRQLPRMGKRKRQVLEILNRSYEHGRRSAKRFKEHEEADLYLKEGHLEVYEDLKELFTEANLGWVSREHIFSSAAGEELPPSPWLKLPIGDETRMLLEVAPPNVRAEYDRLAEAADKARTSKNELESWGKWIKLIEFELAHVKTLKNREAFQKRWGALKSSVYAAIRVLEKEGLIERRKSKAGRVTFRRITRPLAERVRSRRRA
jgi:transposase